MTKLKLINMSVLSAIVGMSLVADAGTSDTQVVNVSLTTYSTTFDPATFRSGKVTFIIKNEANDMVHEIRIVKTDLPLDKLPLERDGSVDEDSTQFTTIASAEDLDPGKSRAVTVELEAGRYVYFCNKHNHYLIGMRGEFHVQP